MIIFGTRGLTLKKGPPGQFFCPGCNGRRTYQRKKVQRFFTLYFIPLIPLDVLQEFVQCQTCKQNYKPVVLEHDPTVQREAQNTQLNENYRALLVHFARMSGRKDRAFVDHVAELFRGFNGGQLTGDEVAADIERPALNIVPATERLAPAINERGREAVVTALIDVAGPLDETKRAALDEVVKTLGMTDAHYRGVLAGVAAPAVAEASAQVS